MPDASVPVDPQARDASLRLTRRLRAAALFCLGFPAGFTLLLVLVNRLVKGSTAAFVSGAPWTRVFWSAMFLAFVAGVPLSMVAMTRRCPRCRNPFFHRPRHGSGNVGPGISYAGSGFNANIFSSRCINCGTSIDGTDLT
jgi:hypothetical protein